MDVEAAHVYPNCPTVTRTVMVGGLTKSELLEELQRNVIAMNELGERLFASKHFTTSPTRCTLTPIELTVHDLGCPQGATITEIYERAKALDLTTDQLLDDTLDVPGMTMATTPGEESAAAE